MLSISISLFQPIDDDMKEYLENVIKEQVISLRDSVFTTEQCLRTAQNCSHILSEDPRATSGGLHSTIIIFS